MTYLKYTNKETIRHQLSISLGAVLQKRENTPPRLQSRNRVIHRKHWENKGKRQLPDNSSSDIHCVEIHELVGVESKVLFETRDIGIR